MLARSRCGRTAFAVVLGMAVLANVAAAEPLRVRRNLIGMHNLKDGGIQFEIGFDWTKNLSGSTGFVFDWVTDFVPWIEAAFERDLIPCIRVQECNGGPPDCYPGAGYAGNVAWTVLNYKLAHPQYADRLVYLQLWNEPGDPRATGASRKCSLTTWSPRTMPSIKQRTTQR